jgi:hypothetical protein
MLLCMRTTIRLDDQLLIEIEQYAVRSGQTLTAVIEDALRLMLANQKQLEKQEKDKLLTVEGNGAFPGVDLDDSASLLDFVEEANAPD